MFDNAWLDCLVIAFIKKMCCKKFDFFLQKRTVIWKVFIVEIYCFFIKGFLRYYVWKTLLLICLLWKQINKSVTNKLRSQNKTKMFFNLQKNNLTLTKLYNSSFYVIDDSEKPFLNCRDLRDQIYFLELKIINKNIFILLTLIFVNVL